jgi:cell division protein ZapA
VSEATKPVSVTILEKEYLIACSEEERDLLNDAAILLNDKMQEVKTSGKIIGSERIAVLAALNIAHEMLAYKSENEGYTSNVDGVVRRLHEKIDDALMKGTQIEVQQ